MRKTVFVAGIVFLTAVVAADDGKSSKSNDKSSKRKVDKQRQPVTKPGERYVITQEKDGTFKYTPEKPLILPLFSVKVALDKKHAKEGDEELAQEVLRVLSEQKPTNPGRAQTFGFLTRKDSPYEWAGWHLNIREVQGKPGDWKAKIIVFARTKHKEVPEGEQQQKSQMSVILNRHTEVYKYSGGKLVLESQEKDSRKMLGF